MPGRSWEPADKMAGKRNIPLKKTIRDYSIFYLLFFLLCIFIFYLPLKKSFFSISDGRHQQYIYFLYVGVWFRELCSNIFVRHVFELPMWDSTIGMGADAITTGFTGFLVPDPFYWVAAFIPLSLGELVFDIIVVVKSYFAGLCFIFYTAYKKFPEKGQIAGALVYTFSATAYIGLWQASFINAFFFLPLILLGVDRVWYEKKYVFYVLILASSTMCSYYFTFMIGIYVVLYCILNYLTDGNKRSVKGFISLLVRLSVPTVIGLGLSMWSVLPNLLAISSNERLDNRFAPDLFSTIAAKNIFLYSFSGKNFYHDMTWGCSSAAFICLVLLLTRKGRRPLLKICAVALPILFMIPPFCNLFNGMMFPTDRNLFGLCFVAALVVASEFDRISELKDKILYICLGGSMVYLVIEILVGGFKGLMSGLSLFVVTVLIAVFNRVLAKKEKALHYSHMFVLFISCFILSYSQLSDISGAQEFGGADDYMFRTHGVDLVEGRLSSDFRFDYESLTYDDTPVNSSCILRYNGYDFYNSSYNPGVNKYFLDLSIVSDAMGFNYAGLRGRPLLEIMNASRYVLHYSAKDTSIAAPYSYEYVTDNGEYELYEASRDVSLVYYYDDTLSPADFDAVPPIAREEMLTRACLFEGAQTSFDYVSGYETVTLGTPVSDTVEITEGGFIVNEPGDYVSYPIDPVEGQEISVYLDGINSYSPFVIVVAAVSDGDIVKVDLFSGINEDNVYYHQKDQLLFDLGYIEESIDEIRLLFYSKAEYTLDGIEVYTRSPEALDEIIDSFYDHADMEDISYSLEGNHMSIQTVTEGDRYLLIAVPYSEGWTAAVDGEKTEILHANDAFMAIRLSDGAHDIKLDYCTPHLKAGALITLVSAAGLAAYVTVTKRRKEI